MICSNFSPITSILRKFVHHNFLSDCAEKSLLFCKSFAHFPRVIESLSASELKKKGMNFYK